MLDLQRRRQKPRSAPAIIFTRILIATHFFAGLTAASLLMFHELFRHAVVVAVWLLLTMLMIWNMMRQKQWSRILLGLFLGLGVIGSLFMLIWVMPTLDRDAPVMLTRRVLPFWLTLLTALYGGLSLLVLASRRVWRATEKGFNLMEVPDSPYE
jgi:hypothetical protein